MTSGADKRGAKKVKDRHKEEKEALLDQLYRLVPP
jgi:hypothetical protein